MRVLRGILRRVGEGVEGHFTGIQRVLRGILRRDGEGVQGHFIEGR